MSDDKLYLEATSNLDKIKIGLHYEQSTWTYEEITVPMNSINQKCNEMIELINRMIRQKNRAGQSIEPVKSIGRLLSDLLLTPDIKHRLKKSKTKPLVIRLDEQLIHIPWELLSIDDELLCLKFITGREIKTRQQTQRNKRNSKKPFQMWIITNSGMDLKEATREGVELCRMLDKANQYDTIIESIHNSEVEPFDIYEKISDYDFIHFAGHAEYNDSNPEIGGWKLKNGIFTVPDIDKLKYNSGMPYIIFSNACQSARTDIWCNDDLSRPNKEYNFRNAFSLANAFMIAGVHHFIGTIWEISDKPGNAFAIEFYKQLIAGNCIGEAVRQSRLKVIQDHHTDISWASYLLYGNPSVTYLHDKNKSESESINDLNGNYEKSDLPISVESSTQADSHEQSGLRTLWPKTEKKMKHKINTGRFLLAGLFMFCIICSWFAYKTIVPYYNNLIYLKKINMLENKIRERNKHVKKLYEEYLQKIPLKQSSDHWKFGPLAMAMVFDSASFRHESDQIILHAIQSRIIESNTGIVILDRRSFDHILTELLQHPPQESLLYFPSILLSLALHHSDNNILVLMQLDDIQQGNIIALCNVNLSKKMPILKQKTQLTEDLMKHLFQVMHNYPLRGRITDIQEKVITINIGEYEGVHMGYRFRIFDHNALLKVIAIKRNSSKCSVFENNTINIHEDMMVEQIFMED